MIEEAEKLVRRHWSYLNKIIVMTIIKIMQGSRKSWLSPELEVKQSRGTRINLQKLSTLDLTGTGPVKRRSCSQWHVPSRIRRENMSRLPFSFLSMFLRSLKKAVTRTHRSQPLFQTEMRTRKVKKCVSEQAVLQEKKTKILNLYYMHRTKFTLLKI